jgi:hypothetical protein
MHIWFQGCKTNEDEHGMGFEKGIKEDKREGTGNTKREQTRDITEKKQGKRKN